MKPWKRDRRCSAIGAWERFNGATAMKPWKSRIGGRVAETASMSFNGATAMKPWKRRIGLGLADHARRFNGATAMKPWKRLQTRRSRRMVAVLQWGHGDEAVEENGGGGSMQDGTGCASMGPRR